MESQMQGGCVDMALPGQLCWIWSSLWAAQKQAGSPSLISEHFPQGLSLHLDFSLTLWQAKQRHNSVTNANVAVVKYWAKKMGKADPLAYKNDLIKVFTVLK